MEKNSSFAKLVYLLAIIAPIIGFTAFSQTPVDRNANKKEQLSKDNDTTRNSKLNKNETGSGLDQLDMQLKQLDLHMDKLDAELKNLKLEEVQRHLDETMKKLDEQKINEKVDAAIKKINWDKLNSEINESVAKIDKEKMMEVRKEMEKVKLDLEKQKQNMRFSAPRIDMKKIRVETEKAMRNAKISMQKAKEELQNLRAFTDALQSDGLIDKSKPYKIDVKEGELYINGTKQPKEINEKYKRYYKKENFTINTNGDSVIRI